MNAVDSFLAMGGYAVYVWSAYGVAAAVLTGLFVVSVAGYRRQQRDLKALQSQRGREARR